MESDSHIYGLLGRIHVQMRRTVNRITDVEYMRINNDYAREIVRVGETTGNAELLELCARLKVAMDLDDKAIGTAQPPAEGKHSLLSLFSTHRQEPDEDGDNRYIHSLR